ncbi:endonuclease/exonuclease/phosphatase family protein [Gilvibacter sp.]|uniref:endonuclease/exonuclease/phosphatase family protein n=1 Tax=Gilvibacter sp. TaxID=2729997 RepID=UPI0025C53E3F|nr:endonuclease/exonuclease/phosphatase family protein [Gilvibacter sp.]NQX78040.1 endonuclease/exonuclease/phosphatase family protein [Gilvibacter sp.]
MKLIDKILYALNVVAAILLTLSFITPYIAPDSFPLLSALSLLVSPLLAINLAFVIYWLFRLKKRIWVSAVLLLIAYVHFNAFWKWGSESAQPYPKQLKVMSFNVELFEAYRENPDPEVKAKMQTLINEQSPDVLLIQEYHKQQESAFSAFPHKYIHFRGNRNLGHAIFSKHPIIAKGAFDFNKTGNNTLFADIVTQEDTLRVYNVHLQSFKIAPNVSDLQDQQGNLIRRRISQAFKLQQEQAAAVLEHSGQSGYPVIMGGDLNNTAFSYVYRRFALEYQDAYAQKGSGLGSTFTFDFYPIRIDYIFADQSLSIDSFETLGRPFGDHRPVLGTIGWE